MTKWDKEIVKEFPRHVCQICKKREATRLCDFVTASWQWAGHPPKGDWDGIGNPPAEFLLQPMQGHDTCDKMMCDKCSVTFGETDFCRNHYNIVKNRG